jgi:hypothetical protein
MVSTEFADHRRLASMASGGTSDGPVYAAPLRTALAYDLLEPSWTSEPARHPQRAHYALKRFLLSPGP